MKRLYWYAQSSCSYWCLFSLLSTGMGELQWGKWQRCNLHLVLRSWMPGTIPPCLHGTELHKAVQFHFLLFFFIPEIINLNFLPVEGVTFKCFRCQQEQHIPIIRYMLVCKWCIWFTVWTIFTNLICMQYFNCPLLYTDLSVSNNPHAMPHTQYIAMRYTVWPLAHDTHTHHMLQLEPRLPNCRPADHFLAEFQFHPIFYGLYWCSWISCSMNKIPEGFFRILMLSTYFIQLISTSHLEVFAFYLLMTSPSQCICSFMNIKPLPSLTLQSTRDLNVPCRPKHSKALGIWMSPAGLNAPKRSCCPLHKSIALCEQNRSSLLPDMMTSLSKHVCTFINVIQAQTSK